MALKTVVKVTVNNLSDARYCAGMGVDFIGFSISQEDPFFLSPENFGEISEWLSGVNFVAEFGSHNNMNLDDYDVDFIQINDIALAKGFPDSKIILKGSPQQMREWKVNLSSIPNIEFLLIEIDDNKDEIDNINLEFSGYPLLIGYDLTIADVERVANSTASGIALKGSDEIKPGLKDYDELADILETLEVDEPY